MKIKLFILINSVILVVMVVLQWPDGRSKIVFCDVGQGDGAIIIKGSFQMVIDVGPDNKKMLTCLSRYLPFWDKTIEAVVITHNDEDHIGSLKILKEYYNVQDIYSDKLKDFDVLRYKDIQFEILSSGCEGCDSNQASTVGLLSTGDKKILMMADVPATVEQKLVWRKRLGEVNVLKVSHHGSAVGTSEELLSEVTPVEAIISVGKNNRFGHPTKEVLERLNKYGVKVRRTDESGDIVYVMK